MNLPASAKPSGDAATANILTTTLWETVTEPHSWAILKQAFWKFQGSKTQNKKKNFKKTYDVANWQPSGPQIGFILPAQCFNAN